MTNDDYEKYRWWVYKIARAMSKRYADTSIQFEDIQQWLWEGFMAMEQTGKWDRNHPQADSYAMESMRNFLTKRLTKEVRAINTMVDYKDALHDRLCHVFDERNNLDKTMGLDLYVDCQNESTVAASQIIERLLTIARRFDSYNQQQINSRYEDVVRLKLADTPHLQICEDLKITKTTMWKYWHEVIDHYLLTSQDR